MRRAKTSASSEPADETRRMEPGTALVHLLALPLSSDTQPLRTESLRHFLPTEWSAEPERLQGGHAERSDLQQVCPQIDDSLPAISRTEEDRVDAWWDAFMPAYRRNDADAMIQRILDFMNEYPTLFVHLGLDEECLFDLGAELARRNDLGRYVDLLLTIRERHPEVYVRSYGFHDRDLIGHLVAAGRQGEAANYFDLFRQYPDAFPDALGEVIDILLAANCGPAAFELTRDTAISLLCSPNVPWAQGAFAMRWYLFERWLPVLDHRDASDESCRRLLLALESSGLPLDAEFDPLEIARALSALFTEIPWQEMPELRRQEDADAFYQRVCWRFCTFLHQSKGLGWATARYLADRIEEYCCEIPDRKRRKQPFAFDLELLAAFLAKNCREFMYIKGIRAVSLLYAVQFFCAFLTAQGVLAETARQQVRVRCIALYADCRRQMAATDPALRIFADFPRYRWASNT